MIKKKSFAIVMLCLVFMVLALGSGSEESTHDSVKIGADGQKEESSNAKKNDNADDKATIKYEISDTGFEYFKNSIGINDYYGYFEIKNTGTCDIYLEDCSFDLEDNSGHLLQSDKMISSCPSVISPGEKGYFYNSIGSTYIDDGVSLENGLKLVPQMKLKKATGKPKSYPVSDVSVRNGNYNDIKITGRVENTSSEELSYIYVRIIFYDAKGKVIGFAGTSLTGVGAGLKSSFEASTMFGNDQIKVEDIANTTVIAEEMYYQW